MKTPLRVLIVEDSEIDAELVLRQLKKAGYSVHHERVETAKDMKGALENQKWDLVISDYTLSRFNAPAALALLQKTKLDIPFIVVSGTIGEEDAVELMKAGAHDYLMKDKLARLVPVVRREFAEVQMRQEHKKVEEESLLLVQAVKSTRDCISITDLENKILFVNDSFLATYGYSEAELLGKNISIIRSPIVSSEESDAVQSGTMRVGWHGEIRNRRKNGDEFMVELWTSIVMNNFGRPIAMVGVARDITERKRTEEAIEKSEEKFRQMFDDAPLGYHEIDIKGKIKNINRMELEMLGYTLEEMRDAPVWKFNSDREESKKRILSKLAGTMPCDKQVERTYTRKNGTTIPVLLDDGLLKDEKGNITGIRTIIQDITERNRAEEELKKSKERFELIFKFAPDAYYLSDLKGNFIDGNNAAEIITGYNKEELIGGSFLDLNLLSLDQFPKAAALLVKNVMGKPTGPDEFILKRKAGDKIPVEITTYPIELEKGTVVLGIARDLTERKRAEEALRKSEETLSRITNSIEDVIYSVNGQTQEFTYLSPAFEKLLGYTIADVRQMGGRRAFLSKVIEGGQFAEQDVEFEKLRSNIKSEAPIWEAWWRCKDGSLVCLEDRSIPTYDGERLLNTDGVLRNITDRKHAEKAINESQALYHSLVEQLPAGVFRKDSEGRYVFVNSYFCQLKGLNADEILGKTPHELSVYESAIENSRTPEMIGTQRTLAEQDSDHHKLIMSTGKPIELEEIYPQSDGMTQYFQVVKLPVFASDGKIIGSQGIHFDITERKLAEEARHISEKLFRDLFNASPDAIVLIDPNNPGISWPIVDCNEAACQMNGYTREELVGHSIDILNPTEGTREERIAYIKNLRIKGTIHVEIFHRHKDGHIFPIEVSTTIITLGGREMVLGIDRDITERKRAEKALRQSEENYRSIFDNAAEGIFQSTPEGKFLKANLTMARILGFSSPEELIRERTDIARQSYVHPEQREEFKRLMEQQNKVSGIEYEVPRKDGSLVWVSETAQTVRDAAGRIVRYEGIFIDITERKKAEIELKESEERYRRLVEFSPDAIAVHSEGKIVYVNPAAITLLGANNASELIGKPFLDIIHPDYRDSVHQQIIAVIKEEYAIPPIEQKFMRLDGSCIEVEVAALPIVYKEKSAMQIVVRDISEQKKLQNQLMQTQKIQSIGTLAGGIAHDFNNILGIILAYSSLLDKNKLSPDKFANSIAAINQAVQRGAALVRQILTFARKTDVVFEPMDISVLIHELLSMLEQTFPKTITFSESIENDLPFIFADRTQVHQTLLNLCINARDAMPNGGSISLVAEKRTKEQMNQQFPDAEAEAYVCLTVTDTGKGMDEATCLRVFDPFFTTKEKGKGTGLGLSVVYGVIQVHHGFIDLKSEPGCGTTFWLFFPIPAINKQTADSQLPTESFEIGGTETILFVEDEEMLIQMVTFLLESKGYKVLCARDGLEAVQVYQSHKQEIALVLTDMGLPVMTGTDEFKKIREINPNSKVIFASGYFEPDLKSELLKDGANGFIQKPYEPNDILRIVRQALDQKV
ncbi:MAG: PAS domain S-box protein [Ignavibacteriales bacterium]|nr:PAS domain S-box protein [Ignavibacteriales bacterium]